MKKKAINITGYLLVILFLCSILSIFGIIGYDIFTHEPTYNGVDFFYVECKMQNESGIYIFECPYGNCTYGSYNKVDESFSNDFWVVNLSECSQ